MNKKAVKKCVLDIDDLREGEKVELRVCAENEAGVGEPSDTCSFTAKEPFSPPGRLTTVYCINEKYSFLTKSCFNYQIFRQCI